MSKYPPCHLRPREAGPKVARIFALTLPAGHTKMMWGSILTECSALILRWLHVVAGIAWIGSSFPFHPPRFSLITRRPARGRCRRGVAGSRRRLLPDGEISGGAKRDAGRTDLVQMGRPTPPGLRFRADGGRHYPMSCFGRQIGAELSPLQAAGSALPASRCLAVV